jgi:integrase-like protein
MRRIALDTETIVLLREHKARCQQRYRDLGAEWNENTYVFTSARSDELSVPYSPDAISSRYKKMATRLGINTHIHALRHYSATELLTAGVDLRTVAGRLGTRWRRSHNPARLRRLGRRRRPEGSRDSRLPDAEAPDKRLAAKVKRRPRQVGRQRVLSPAASEPQAWGDTPRGS